MIGVFTDPHRRHLLLTVVVGAGLAVYLAGWAEAIYGFDLAMLLALAGGFPIYLAALTSLTKRRISADLAVSLAAFAALYLGYTELYDENMYLVAAEVIFIMLIGEALENFAIGRTRSGIAALLKLRVYQARVRRHGREHVVPANQIEPDDVVLLQPGDRIAVDGRVLSGSSSVDQSPITGESMPADKTAGDEVFAGTLNLYGALEVSVERLGRDTTLEQIIRLVEEAEAAKAPIQRLADRYAGFFVPVVLAAAVLTYLLTGNVVRAVAVLVVACPCALVLATPTAIAAAIGSLVRRGVLVKGGAVLEHLGRLRSVVFDKTGTLTLAKLRVVRIVTAPGCDEAEVLRLGASVERHSEHALGRLIVDRAAQQQIAPEEATGFLAHPGLGAEAVVAGETVRVGNPRFLQQAKVALPDEFLARVEQLRDEGCTVVLIARNQQPLGAVAVQDTVRPEAADAIRRLRELGIERVAMLTGDHEAAAQAVARSLAIEEVQSGLLPADKVAAVRRVQREAPPVAMVGDGINDAPSLATAEVGVAMAEIGTDVAVASAGVVLVGDDLGKLPEAVACGRATRRIIRQNILAFAVVFNVLAVVAASLGWISPVAAAVLHQVSSLTVVLNSMRLLIDPARWRSRWEGLAVVVRRRWRPAAAAGFLLAVIVYLSSGVHVVSPGQVAVVQRFGRIVHSDEPPGLHYRLPYPFGRHRTVSPKHVRRVEVGFRTAQGSSEEPPAYEWNVQHRGGLYRREQREADVLAGDENLVDVNLVVHYRVSDPLAAMVNIGELQTDGRNKWDNLVRAVAESALRAEMSHQPIETVLGSRRSELEQAVETRVAGALQKYKTGFEVRCVCLADVHPPLEVVPAFREVAGAQEKKEEKINQAQAEQYEIEAQARGRAGETILAAEAFHSDRTQRALGEAQRFEALADAYHVAPGVTGVRLYLQTVEGLLAGRRKIVLDRIPPGARRRVLLGPKGIWNLSGDAQPDEIIKDVEIEGNQGP